MRDVWVDYQKWQIEGKGVVLASVVYVEGSSLRPIGSKMIFSSTGELSGSVSGGCVEGSVFTEAVAVAKDGKPRLVSYGVSNEAAWEVGLSCGGELKVFVESMSTEPWETILPAIQESIETNQVSAIATVLDGKAIGNKALFTKTGGLLGSLGSDQLDKQIQSILTENWSARDPKTITLIVDEIEVNVFVDYLLPPPRLIIIGAVHMAIPLVTFARETNFHTIVVDARRAFATRERFPNADELIVDWPAKALQELKIDSSTCIVTLSHDDKQDNPALLYAISSPAAYIGALGSRVTHAKRVAALKEEGATEDQLKRIHAPVGLKLGGKQPSEIALGIMAEIIAEMHGGLPKAKA